MSPFARTGKGGRWLEGGVQGFAANGLSGAVSVWDEWRWELGPALTASLCGRPRWAGLCEDSSLGSWSDQTTRSVCGVWTAEGPSRHLLKGRASSYRFYLLAGPERRGPQPAACV